MLLDSTAEVEEQDEECTGPKTSAWKKPVSFPPTLYWPEGGRQPHFTSSWQEITATSSLERESWKMAAYSKINWSIPLTQGKQHTARNIRSAEIRSYRPIAWKLDSNQRISDISGIDSESSQWIQTIRGEPESMFVYLRGWATWQMLRGHIYRVEHPDAPSPGPWMKGETFRPCSLQHKGNRNPCF